MDWPAVLEEARAQSVVIPAFSQCKAYAMDEAERREIQRQVQSLAARSIRSLSSIRLSTVLWRIREFRIVF